MILQRSIENLGQEGRDMSIDRDPLKNDTDIVRVIRDNKKFEEMDRGLRLVASDDRTRDFEKAKIACLKAFDAIVDGIKIFFSFVGNNSRFAFALFNSLNKADTKNRLCRAPPFPYMFHRSASRAIGDVYSQQILDALRRTHWMFVVVPSDEAVSSFVDFEIGAFCGNKTLIDRLICIHHPAVAPIEIAKHFDQVQTTHDDLSRMFESLCSDGNSVPGIPPLCNPGHIAQAGLVGSLVSKAASLRPKRARPVMLQFSIHLRGDKSAKNTNAYVSLQDDLSTYKHLQSNNPEEVRVLDSLPANDFKVAPVSGTDTLAEIFGWTSMPGTFGDLTSKIELKHAASVRPWKVSLISQIADIDQGTPPSANYIAFHNFQGSKRYRSSVISFVKREDPREVLSILFGLQEAVLYPSTRAPVLLEVLETTMRLSYRFRWEVLERFQGRIEVADIEMIENRLVAAEQELIVALPARIAFMMRLKTMRRKKSKIWKRSGRNTGHQIAHLGFWM